MPKYIGPKCRLARREGVAMPVKSNATTRSLESKCKLDTPPGMHGKDSRRKTNYGIQLRMKQLIKRYYNLFERQFHNYYLKASRKHGSTGENLLQMLESRLDNIVYRLGFACTRAEARQLVSHRSIKVNGRTVNIPSYLVMPNDQIEINEKSKKQARIISSVQAASDKPQLDWLSLDEGSMKGVLKRYPVMDEMPPEFKVHQVVELYSK